MQHFSQIVPRVCSTSVLFILYCYNCYNILLQSLHFFSIKLDAYCNGHVNSDVIIRYAHNFIMIKLYNERIQFLKTERDKEEVTALGKLFQRAVTS